MKNKLIVAALLSAVSGTSLIVDQAMAEEKKLECIRRLPDEIYQQYPLKYQKNCEVPPPLAAPAPTATEPTSGSYTS